MEAVIQIGGEQYTVKEGDEILSLGQQPLEEETSINKVLMIKDGENVRVGTPYVDGATVLVKSLRHKSGKKVATLRYRSTKNSSTKSGQRKRHTVLSVIKISA